MSQYITPTQSLLPMFESDALEHWEHIRRAELNGAMHYSVLDIFKFYGDTTNAAQEWRTVLGTLEKQGFRSDIEIIQHRFGGQGQRDTPVAPLEVFLRIAQVTSFKHWEHIRRAMSSALAREIESTAQKKMRQTIDYYDSVGWGNRPEINLLRAKYEASQSLADVKSAISGLVTLTGYEWADFFSVEIQSLLGFAISEVKRARSAKSVRDSLNVFEYNALTHAERDLIALLSIQKQVDKQRLISTVQMVFVPIGKNLQAMLDNIGYNALTGLPALPSGNN